MQSDDHQFATSRRRISPAIMVILALAVVALAVSLTDQVTRESSPDLIYVERTGTPGTALLAETLDAVNAPPDFTSLTDGEESNLAIDAVASVQPAVITVQRDGESAIIGSTADENDDRAIGSGVIVDIRGYALASLRTTGTNSDITVVFANGETARAKVVAVDETYQLVLIKIDGDIPAVASLASYMPVPGERVLAIGSALDDFYSTVTGGVVSASGSTMPGEGNRLPIRGVIQHDAAINEGNEGGPLLDLNGDVIAINVGSVTSDNGETAQGWSFAVPIAVIQELIAAVR